jgi:hypothetical protein
MTNIQKEKYENRLKNEISYLLARRVLELFFFSPPLPSFSIDLLNRMNETKNNANYSRAKRSHSKKNQTSALPERENFL